MKRFLRFLLLLICGANLYAVSYAKAKPVFRTVHVIVVLADNRYQGIVPISKTLGDGQNPKTNLYWGAAYGAKSFFSRDPSWQLLPAQQGQNVLHAQQGNGALLERVIFKNAQSHVIMVADAYDGRAMAPTLERFMRFATGADCETLTIQGHKVAIGGCADLLVFVGHNGLMDAPLEKAIDAEKTAKPNRQVAVFACMSQQYFSSSLKKAGIEPAILTTQLMAPEAYNVSALIEGWSAGKSKTEIRDKVAASYSHYQKLKAPARRLFATEYLP